MIHRSKNIKLPLIFFIGLLTMHCSEEDASVSEEVKNDSCYAKDHEWIIAATELKEKLGLFQQDFTSIANKELEETVCPEGASAPFNGNQSDVHVWLMMNYLLDNFDPKNFGQYDFGMPADKLKREIPITELNWLNFTSDSSNPDFSIYSDYPDLKNVPTTKIDSSGSIMPYKKPLLDASTLVNTFKDGIVGVVAIVDYLPPTFVSNAEFETGYIIGYMLLGDWKNGKLSCMMPLLAENSPGTDFTGYKGEEIQNGQKAPQLVILEDDLKLRTFEAIKEIVRKMTGFSGTVIVNH